MSVPGLRHKYATASGDSFWISTESVDHEGDKIFAAGCDLSVYVSNPVILYLHDNYGTTAAAGIPIGTCAGLQIIPGRGVRCQGIDWLQGDEFTDRVKNAWDQRVLRGLSIGFIPLDGQRNDTNGYDITKWRLLEFSLVPVPANYEAVRP